MGVREVDWISNLPDCLLCKVLLKLPTKDVVKTSVLSSRWRYLWKYVPGLNLGYCDFQVPNTFSIDHNTFLSFVDSFLDFNSQSCLQSFKLEYDSSGYGETEIALITRWINSVVRRKVKYLKFLDDSCESYDLQMPLPLSIYTCESLVCLTLDGLLLATPKFVSLPCLKVLHLSIVKFADDLTLETLISQCPVLQNLLIQRSFCDDFEFTCVRSQSLLSFTQVADCDESLVEDLVVAIEAPRLRYLRLSDGRTASFILKNLASLVEADIDIVFNLIGKKVLNDLQKRYMIRNFLVGVSSIKKMTIASRTLEVIYDYSRCEPLPLFRNLSTLRVEFYGYRWEMLPVFLENCPTLKSLVVGSANYREKEEIHYLSGPRHFLSSLESVEIERPLKGEAMEMKLVSYLLENSTILKKLTLCLDDFIKAEESVILKELRTIPRLSKSCQVVVL